MTTRTGTLDRGPSFWGPEGSPERATLWPPRPGEGFFGCEMVSQHDNLWPSLGPKGSDNVILCLKDYNDQTRDQTVVIGLFSNGGEMQFLLISFQ